MSKGFERTQPKDLSRTREKRKQDFAASLDRLVKMDAITKRRADKLLKEFN